MSRLSVNVNKVATVRNSRGGRIPSVIDAVRVCIDAGAPGITVHPRADARHITTADVHEIAEELAPLRGTRRVQHRRRSAARPRRRSCSRCGPISARSCRSCPARSRARRDGASRRRAMRSPRSSRRCSAAGVRVSLFVDPAPAPVRWARELGADRVELYTEPFARAFERGPAAADASFSQYVEAARRGARSSGWASTPATISTCGTSRCSGRSRISMKCRSGTRSSATRCSSGCARPSSTIVTALAGSDR